MGVRRRLGYPTGHSEPTAPVYTWPKSQERHCPYKSFASRRAASHDVPTAPLTRELGTELAPATEWRRHSYKGTSLPTISVTGPQERGDVNGGRVPSLQGVEIAGP